MNAENAGREKNSSWNSQRSNVSRYVGRGTLEPRVRSGNSAAIIVSCRRPRHNPELILDGFLNCEPDFIFRLRQKKNNLNGFK